MAITHQGAFDASAVADVTKTLVGTSPSDTIGFYGVTPVSQRTNSIQAVSLISVASNATISSNIAAFFTEVANTLIGLGFWKGS